MAKHYESQKDRENEVDIVRVLLSKGMVAKKLPAMHCLDWAVLTASGSVIAFVEIKDRPTWKHKYGNIIINLEKWANLCSLQESSGVPCLFAVRIKDGETPDEKGGVYVVGVKPVRSLAGKVEGRMFMRNNRAQSGYKAVPKVTLGGYLETQGR